MRRRDSPSLPRRPIRNSAYANGTTDPTLEGEFDLTGPERSLGFQVNIPLRLFDRNQGNKKTAVFQADASRFTLRRRTIR